MNSPAHSAPTGRFLKGSVIGALFFCLNGPSLSDLFLRPSVIMDAERPGLAAATLACEKIL
jgi:hypothetical protein